MHHKTDIQDFSSLRKTKREFPKKELAQLVISACCQFNIETVVVSPGSRNAPLTVGFFNHPNIEALSVVDERCAAFFALGIAQQTQKPVAVVCTSGSALLNYYPAIAEAFYSNIPLIIISADRPKHLIDIGDGQTIRQENVFQNHILFSANLNDNSLDANVRILSEAIQKSKFKKGPVHINVPFDEPLYETVNTLNTFNFNEDDFEYVLQGKETYFFEEIADIWNASTKKMILIGVNYPNEKVQNLLNHFVDDDSVLILTETTSNLYHQKYINSIDQLIFSLEDEQFKELQPDILITFGGLVVSKKIKQFLRKYQPSHHWHINEYKKLDTFFCLTEYIQEKPANFLYRFLGGIRKNKKESIPLESKYQSKWLKIRDDKRVKHTEYLAKTPHSDFKSFEQVLESIPNNCQLQVSNSAVIRYVQLFQINKTLSVFCNRGTSGIDGSTSTAIGASYASEKQTVFITGDLSFFYDSNALWNGYIKKDFRIILINNSGGGIFKIIPGPSSTNAATYFETPHSLTAEHLCKMYGFEYETATSTEMVSEKIKNFYKIEDKPKLLEIFTPREQNNTILKEYFNYIH